MKIDESYATSGGRAFAGHGMMYVHDEVTDRSGRSSLPGTRMEGRETPRLTFDRR